MEACSDVLMYFIGFVMSKSAHNVSMPDEKRTAFDCISF